MSQAMAQLFQRITTGVYVIGVADAVRPNAFTAAWVMPVSFQPLLLALSINPDHASYALLKAGGHFTVNVLGKSQLALAAHFGTPGRMDKLAGHAWHSGRSGAPLLDDALALFECSVTAELPAGDHVLTLGRVLWGELRDPSMEPLIYRDTGNLDGAAAIFPDDFE